MPRKLLLLLTSALLSAAPAAAEAGSGAGGIGPFRDRPPHYLTSHAVGSAQRQAHATDEARGPKPRRAVLPAGVLDPARYDLPVVLNREVAGWLAHFRGRGKGTMARRLARLGRYEAMLLKALKRHGLPPDLVYVPLVESGYSAVAVSHAGATGLWQFMESAADTYGLDRTGWKDQRRDPVAATDAACRFLKDLHKRFDSWELALAAYNAGPARLANAVRRYNTNDFWRLARYEYLPKGSRQYVAKILAVVIVGKNREAFGFEGVVPERPPETRVVTVDGGTRLKTVARAAGVDLAEIEALNSIYTRGAVPPEDETGPVTIPAASLERFTRRFDRLAKRSKKRYERHTLRFGETVADLAKDRRVPLRAILVVNDLRRVADARPGDRIVIPVPKRRRRAKKRRRSRAGGGQVVVLPPVDYVYPGRALVYFRVPQGYTAEGVAAHFRVDAEDLHMWNGLDHTVALYPRTVLRLYVPSSLDLSATRLLKPETLKVVVADTEEFQAALDAARAAANGEPPPPGVKRKRRRYRKHTVRRGETLWKLAKRYKITVADLKRTNKVRKSGLRPGDVLRVPRASRK